MAPTRFGDSRLGQPGPPKGVLPIRPKGSHTQPGARLDEFVGELLRPSPQPANTEHTPVTAWFERRFLHYNAGTLRRAADWYADLIDRGGQMMLSMAGAMSTAELGIDIAPMIRAGKIHAISCTGANLEEDVFRLVGHNFYVEFDDYQNLTKQDDARLAELGLPRVTDSSIPEKKAMAIVEGPISDIWKQADRSGQRLFPHEPLYTLLRTGALKSKYQKDPEESWMLAAAEKNLPIVVPGWGDSTLGNVFAAGVRNGEWKPTTIRSDIEYMEALADWYVQTAMKEKTPIGFFQIGGGIAGDFAICVVPMLSEDADTADVPKWAYFCQLTDATESMGGYSGAMPQEKVSWKKIDPDTPAFAVNGDATCLFPLVAARVLGL